MTVERNPLWVASSEDLHAVQLEAAHGEEGFWKLFPKRRRTGDYEIHIHVLPLEPLYVAVVETRPNAAKWTGPPPEDFSVEMKCANLWLANRVARLTALAWVNGQLPRLPVDEPAQRAWGIYMMAALDATLYPRKRSS